MKKLTLLLTALLAAAGADAKVTLPKMFSDGMVMQREADANLWGTAKSGGEVKITTSWDGKTYTAKAGADGKWKTAVATPAAGGPYSITLDDGERTTLDDILIGEVWICSGQSNMEMPMKGFKNQPVENGVEDMLHSSDSGLRLFTVKLNSLAAPVDTVGGRWSHAAPASVRNFSATAYYFGRELRRVLGVPVGLIVTSWGGSSCEAWMRADWLKPFPSAKIPKTQADVKSKNQTPTVLYNGMLHPLAGYTMRGVIWYQGEANVKNHATYADMLTAMIRGWRGEWGQGDFPFYYCQIAPYQYYGKNNSAFLREQQAKAVGMSANTGMAVLMDAGLRYGIHPRKKNLAGLRLALLALDKTYKVEGLTSESPRYKAVTFRGDTAVVTFSHADMGMYGRDGLTSKCFEVAGEDRVFHPAKVWIRRNEVYVKSDAVAHPVAVRYAFKNWADGDMFCAGLPLGSFRTDDWDE